MADRNSMTSLCRILLGTEEKEGTDQARRPERQGRKGRKSLPQQEEVKGGARRDGGRHGWGWAWRQGQERALMGSLRLLAFALWLASEEQSLPVELLVEKEDEKVDIYFSSVK